MGEVKEVKNGSVFRIPHLIIISGVVMALLYLANWSLALDRNKLDKVEFEKSREAMVSIVKERIYELKTDIRDLAEEMKTFRQEIAKWPR